MAEAKAYYPKLSQVGNHCHKMCPLALLLKVVNMNSVKPGFLKKVGRGATLGKYLKLISSCSKPVSPYALRIGGRTWYISHGMDRQFVDYLGTWMSPEASARYYRESPATVLKILNRYYRNVRLDL